MAARRITLRASEYGVEKWVAVLGSTNTYAEHTNVMDMAFIA